MSIGRTAQSAHRQIKWGKRFAKMKQRYDHRSRVIEARKTAAQRLPLVLNGKIHAG